MKLDEFVAEQHEMLEAFKAFWLKRHEQDPKMFPLEINMSYDGNWLEQLVAFEESYDGLGSPQ